MYTGESMSVVSADKLYLVSNHVRSYLGALKSKRVRSENYEWRYLEGGNPDKPTVLFIHGFLGSKALWRTMMHHMVSRYHVIAVDMPGLHIGMQTIDNRYDFPEMADCLHEFVSALNLSHFHLVGHSLGANISAVYAARYTSRIRSLAVLSLLTVVPDRGVGQLTRFSEFRQYLMCREVEGLEKLVAMLYYKPPSVPRIMLQYKLKEIEENRAFLLNVLNDMESSMLFLLKSLRYLPAHALVINGVDDVFFMKDSIDLLRQNVVGLKVRNLPECGHVPFLEKPRELSRIYLEYLDEVTSPSRIMQESAEKESLLMEVD